MKRYIIFHYDISHLDDDLNGEALGEIVGQDSITEFLNNLVELEMPATIITCDDGGKIINQKKVKIDF